METNNGLETRQEAFLKIYGMNRSEGWDEMKAKMHVPTQWLGDWNRVRPTCVTGATQARAIEEPRQIS